MLIKTGKKERTIDVDVCLWSESFKTCITVLTNEEQLP